MNKKEIIIHLGFPKTGSTTIQSMLALNRDLLSPAVYVSPKDELTYQLRKNALRYMRSGGFFWWKLKHRRELKKFVQKVGEINAQRILISDENMIGIESGKLFGPSKAGLYTNWLKDFDQALGGFNVRYVIYTREAESWRKSGYNQAVKMRRVRQRFEAWAKENSDLQGPEKIIAEMRAFLGDRLLTFDMKEDLSNNQLIGANLLKVAGVDTQMLSQVIDPPRQNESLPQAAVDLICLINEKTRLGSRAYRAVMQAISKNPQLFNSEHR
jgi:hypothetical protein